MNLPCVCTEVAAWWGLYPTSLAKQLSKDQDTLLIRTNVIVYIAPAPPETVFGCLGLLYQRLSVAIR
jgi:hypothetical protein